MELESSNHVSSKASWHNLGTVATNRRTYQEIYSQIGHRIQILNSASYKRQDGGRNWATGFPLITMAQVAICRIPLLSQSTLWYCMELESSNHISSKASWHNLGTVATKRHAYQEIYSQIGHRIQILNSASCKRQISMRLHLGWRKKLGNRIPAHYNGASGYLQVLNQSNQRMKVGRLWELQIYRSTSRRYIHSHHFSTISRFMKLTIAAFQNTPTQENMKIRLIRYQQQMITIILHDFSTQRLTNDVPS